MTCNSRGRDFVVGDLHGCMEEFSDLLRRIEFDGRNDRMFSVGDLVDRGPQSLEFLRLLNEPRFFCVLGNHEDMMVEYFDDPDAWESVWRRNGGDWAIGRAGNEELRSLVELARAAPRYHC